MATKYAQNRMKTQDELAQELLGFQEEEARQQIDSDILSTKKSLSQAKQKLVVAESAHPFDSQAIVTAELDVEGYEMGLKRLEDVKKRLFTDEEVIGTETDQA